LRNGFMEMVYPVVALVFIVIGVAKLLAAWF
jgi:hypothetical protein